MPNLFPRVLIALLAASIMVLADDTASAGTVKLGNHSSTEIQSACTAVGGVYTDNGRGYGCAGPGGSVYCNNKQQCTGNCGKCGRTSGITAVLTGQRGTVGTAPTTGGSKTTGPTVPPKPTQGTINR
jgi:hypothetical protein